MIKYVVIAPQIWGEYHINGMMIANSMHLLYSRRISRTRPEAQDEKLRSIPYDEAIVVKITATKIYV